MDKVKRLYELDGELNEILAEESDLYQKAQTNKHNKIERKKSSKQLEAEKELHKAGGKKPEYYITEKEAWEEIRIVGPASKSFEAMKEKYPKLFEAAARREEKQKEINKHMLEHFGVEFPNVTAGGLLRLIDSVVAHKLGRK